MRPLSGGIGSGSANGPTWRPTAETPSSRWYHRGWCPEIDFLLLEMTPVATGQFFLATNFTQELRSQWPEIHICSRSRKPSSGRQWQDQPAMAMDQNWDYTKGPTKHGWCLLFSIKPFIFRGWYLFSGPCPTPWYPPTTTRVSRKSQPLETWMPVRHCQFAIQGHWKPPKARSCQWPYLLTKCGLSMTKWMDPKITLDWNSHEIDGLVRTLPMHHLESCGKPLKPPKKTIEGAKKLLNREKRFWQILRIHPFLFFWDE